MAPGSYSEKERLLHHNKATDGASQVAAGSGSEQDKDTRESSPFPASAAASARSPSASKASFTLLLCVLSAGLGGLLFGYDTGVISGAMLYIEESFPAVDKSSAMQETIVSVAIGGAALGCLIVSQVSQYVGRKTIMLHSDVGFVLGSVAMAAAPAPWMLLLGRLLVGMAVGCASAVVPVYIAEVAPTASRGRFVSGYTFLITFGQFLAYLVNLGLSYVPGTWRWMLGLAAVPALLQAAALNRCPESPTYLASKGVEREANSVLMKLHGQEGYEEARCNLVEELELVEHARAKYSLSSMLSSRTTRKALLVGVALQAFQQLCGINTVMYYSPTILQIAGFQNKQTVLFLSLAVAAMNAAGTVIGMYAIDYYGRRKLLIGSLVGITVGLLSLAAAFGCTEHYSTPVVVLEKTYEHLACEASYAEAQTCTSCLQAGCAYCSNGHGVHAKGWCFSDAHALRDDIEDTCSNEFHGALYRKGCPSRYEAVNLMVPLGLTVYILSFSVGMGVVPWAVNSEIFPLEYRSIANACTSASNWTFNLLVAETFLSLMNWLGTPLTFAFYAGISLLALVFVLRYLPETKGLTFTQIQRLFAS